ncbi:MAG: DUF4249 family protein [Methanosarcina sp.]
MKLCIFLLSILALLSCLTGCEKPVHRMDVDPVRKHLVLNGSLGPDLPFKIHVSSSMEPIGPELVTLVEDAEISITDDIKNTIYPKYDSMGFYHADWYPATNKKYRITVKAPGFEDAYTDITIPEKPEGITFSKDLSNSSYPDLLKINDPGEEENTYMIRVRYQYKETRQYWLGPNLWKYDTIIESRLVSLHSIDELIEYYADGSHIGDSRLPSGEKVASGFLISDELFNGREHSFNFKAGYASRLDPDRPYLFIDVVSLNREFYNFVKSYSLYFEAMQAPFTEPVAILSNIKNGLGYVYGYSVHTDSIRIK